MYEFLSQRDHSKSSIISEANMPSFRPMQLQTNDKDNTMPRNHLLDSRQMFASAL